MFKEYDKIRLKTGEVATILEIFDPTSFLVEIFKKSGGIETPEIKLSDIQSKFIEYEEPVNAVI
jgi:hypothetical protein